MRVAVISDIHGNLHALDAVLRAIDDDDVEAVWCLGDLVGYGPRPNECCARVAERVAVSLVGNHDLAVLGVLDLEDFSGAAAEAAHWTQRVLSEDARAYLSSLESVAERDDAGLYHGSPRDPVWEYVLSGESALAAFALTRSPLILVGHSHVALAFELDGGTITGELVAADTELDLSTGRRLLNPGSVGQPRDGDARAAYVIVDLERRTASFRRVSYPVARTQQEIREQGLPDVLAVRLEHGE